MHKKLTLAVLALLALSLALTPAIAMAQNEGDAAGAAVGFGALGLMSICWLLMLVLSIALLVFWILMIVDVAKRQESQFPNSTGNSKTVWLIVVILLGWIGGVVYYFAVKRKAPLPK